MPKSERATEGRTCVRFVLMSVAALSLAAGLQGCGRVGDSEVLGAVFGLENANAKPFRQGRIPNPDVRPGDAVIGEAANAPGSCIWRRGQSDRRFQAPCPDGYSL